MCVLVNLKSAVCAPSELLPLPAQGEEGDSAAFVFGLCESC